MLNKERKTIIYVSTACVVICALEDNVIHTFRAAHDCEQLKKCCAQLFDEDAAQGAILLLATPEQYYETLPPNLSWLEKREALRTFRERNNCDMVAHINCTQNSLLVGVTLNQNVQDYIAVLAGYKVYITQYHACGIEMMHLLSLLQKYKKFNISPCASIGIGSEAGNTLILDFENGLPQKLIVATKSIDSFNSFQQHIASQKSAKQDIDALYISAASHNDPATPTMQLKDLAILFENKASNIRIITSEIHLAAELFFILALLNNSNKNSSLLATESEFKIRAMLPKVRLVNLMALSLIGIFMVLPNINHSLKLYNSNTTLIEAGENLRLLRDTVAAHVEVSAKQTQAEWPMYKIEEDISSRVQVNPLNKLSKLAQLRVKHACVDVKMFSWSKNPESDGPEDKFGLGINFGGGTPSEMRQCYYYFMQELQALFPDYTFSAPIINTNINNTTEIYGIGNHGGANESRIKK